MELQKAERKKAKIKLAISGASGSGKTYSALLLAYGLCKNWKEIAVIDSENSSANLYSHLGDFNVGNLSAPYSPEKYIEAINACINAKMSVILIDSISHEWVGSGGILDIHSNMVGNSFTNWAKVTPRHNAFINTILQSPIHIIATLRTKQEYVLQEKNGKMVPEKIGLKAVQRDDTDYEFSIVLNIDSKHNAIASKDRTGLFANQPEFRITADTGDTILDWCNNGPAASITKDQIVLRIASCKTVDTLLSLYKEHPQYQVSLLPDFTKKRAELEGNPIFNHQNIFLNGTANNTK